MRILNVTAQKPNSTGSGIFLSELMKEFANKGHTQALVAGVYPEEETPVPDRVTFYPVYFEQGKLNFPIVGMSDEMPYPSTRYRDMTPKMDFVPSSLSFDCHRTGTFSRPEGLWLLP